MSIFQRDRDRQVEVPRISVRGEEATVELGTDGAVEEEIPRAPEQSESRRLKFPKTKWW